MRERLVEAMRAAVNGLLRDAGDAEDAPPFTVEPSRQAEHGDFA